MLSFHPCARLGNPVCIFGALFHFCENVWQDVKEKLEGLIVYGQDKDQSFKAGPCSQLGKTSVSLREGTEASFMSVHPVLKTTLLSGAAGHLWFHGEESLLFLDTGRLTPDGYVILAT